VATADTGSSGEIIIPRELDKNTKPGIVAPVMRVSGVADAARSIVFYRDLLGFEIREHDEGIEAVYGPARILFGTQDYAR
jgi:hypothetical protein